MGSEDKGIPRWKLTYYDDERPDDTVLVGAWEITLAERQFFVGAVDQGSMDAILYAAFKASRRAKLIDKSADFDAWAADVARVDEVKPGESPAPLES